MPGRVDVLERIGVVAGRPVLVDAIFVLDDGDVERAQRRDPAEMVDLGAGQAAAARLAVGRGLPAVVVGHDGVDLLAEVEVADAAADAAGAAAARRA